MSADPTAERIDAVSWAVCGVKGSPYMDRSAAERILTSTDPAVHAALAASLPAEVKAASMTDAEMLAALVDRGNDAELARRLEWATGLIGATLLVAIRSEGLEVVRVKPEQVAP